MSNSPSSHVQAFRFISLLPGLKLDGSQHKSPSKLPLDYDIREFETWAEIAMFLKSLVVCWSSVQFSSVAQSCLTLYDPVNRSTPGLPVHHQLPDFTQTPAPNPSQHQGLFQWVNSSHEVAKVLEFQLQHQSFQWTPRTDLLQDGLIGSPCSPRGSQESSPTHSSRASIFLHSAFLTVQLSHPYMTHSCS